MRTNSSRKVGIAVLVLCAASFALKQTSNAARTGVDHGDVAFYVTVARNLVAGHGFNIDYVWNYWHHPQAIPTASNTWWMPLPSVLCAAGMLFFGTDYQVAQQVMILITSLAPALVFLLARALYDRTDTALVAAALAAVFYHFIDEACAPLSQGPVVLFAATALICALRAARGARWLWYAGAAVGLATLTRSDGIVLFVPVIVLLWRVAPSRIAPLAKVVGGFSLAMLPWWLYNLTRFGSPSPGTPFRALLLRNYPDWYALPESVTWNRFLADGWATVLREKLAATGANAATFASSAFSGVGGLESRWVAYGTLAFLVLSWLGLLSMLRPRFLFFWAHVFALLSLYSWAFTAISHSSFQISLYALYPVLLAAMAHVVVRGAQALAAWLGARRGVALATAGFLGWLLLAQVSYGQSKLRDRAAFIDHLHAFYEPLGEHVAQSVQLAHPTLLASNVHELHAITGLRCVQVPSGTVDDVRRTAQLFDVNLVLITEIDPASFQQLTRRALKGWPGLERLPGPAEFAGTRFELYAVR